MKKGEITILDVELELLLQIREEATDLSKNGEISQEHYLFRFEDIHIFGFIFKYEVCIAHKLLLRNLGVKSGIPRIFNFIFKFKTK